MEPDRSLDSRAALGAADAGRDPSPISPFAGELDLKGLPVGVGREVFGWRAGGVFVPLMTPTGGNLEGTVPARARRAELDEADSAGRGIRSGKPSVGDSGIFSRSGVELPLVGGPQRLGVTRSCAWISLALRNR